MSLSIYFRLFFPFPPTIHFQTGKNGSFIYFNLSENYLNNEIVSVPLCSTLQSEFQECSVTSWLLILGSIHFAGLAVHRLQREFK